MAETTSAVVTTGTRSALSGFLNVGIIVALIICAVAVYAISRARKVQLQNLSEITPTNPSMAIQALTATVAPMPININTNPGA